MKEKTVMFSSIFHLTKYQLLSLFILSCMGISLSLYLFTSIQDFEKEKISFNLKIETTNRILALQEKIDDNIDVIKFITSFFNASDQIERSEFQKFTEAVLQREIDIQALEWVPHVLDSERQAFEALTRKEGFPDFQITERKEQGVMAPARKRDEYFPVNYLEPFKGNEQALGFDLASNPLQVATLNNSRDNGEIKASQRITLVQEVGKQYAFIVYMPVYKKEMLADSVETRRKSLKGFVLGVFRIGDLVEDALSILAPGDLDLYIYDESQPDPDEQSLYNHKSKNQPGNYLPTKDKKNIMQGFYYSMPVRVADRRWQVFSVPTPEFFAARKTWNVFVIPGTVLFFTVFLVSYLFTIYTRVGESKRQAQSLSEANDKLGLEISERKQMEEELRQSETRFRNLVEAIGDWAWEIDENNIYTYVSPKVKNILGYESREILGKNIFDIMLLDESHRVRELFHDISANRKKFSFFENITIHKDGHFVVTETSGVPLFHDDGTFRGYQGVDRDITDRKAAEENLKQSQKMESVGTLAGGIAHEFNNILGGILGYTEIAKEEASEDSSVRESLDKIFNLSIRARDVVKQILSFSRKEKNDLEPLHPHLIIKESLKVLRASIPTTIEIRQNINEQSGTILADQTQIHQISMNLCMNAAHAMEDSGGVLEIGLSPVVLDVEDIKPYTNLKTGEYVKLTVSDTGTGIDPNNIDKIFDPFFTTKEVGKGTGMGLSIVHGIIKDHGGVINVSSKLGEGTTFTIFLPKTEARINKTESDDALPTGTENILVVDDEEHLVFLLKKNMERLGYKVTAMTNSLETLELFKKDPHRYDLIITDLTMPHLTGDRLASKVTAIRPDMPVIIATGYADAIDSDKVKQSGIKAFIPKPYQKEELAKTIRLILD